MLAELNAAVEALNKLTPLGNIALLSFIIILMVHKNGPMRKLSDNHLSGLPVMEESLKRMEQTLLEIRDGINFLKGRY